MFGLFIFFFFGTKMSVTATLLQLLSNAVILHDTEVYVDIAITLQVRCKRDDSLLIPLLERNAFTHWGHRSRANKVVLVSHCLEFNHMAQLLHILILWNVSHLLQFSVLILLHQLMHQSLS